MALLHRHRQKEKLAQTLSRPLERQYIQVVKKLQTARSALSGNLHREQAEGQSPGAGMVDREDGHYATEEGEPHLYGSGLTRRLLREKAEARQLRQKQAATPLAFSGVSSPEQGVEEAPVCLPWGAVSKASTAIAPSISAVRTASLRSVPRKRLLLLMLLIMSLFVLVGMEIFGRGAGMLFQGFSGSTPGANLPLLTVRPAVLHPGQVALLEVEHFRAFAHLYLSHDIRESLETTTGLSRVQVGASGGTVLRVLIGHNWSAGSHFLKAEDLATHYTASTTLQVLEVSGSSLVTVVATRSALQTSFDATVLTTALSFTTHQGQLSTPTQAIILKAGKSDIRWHAQTSGGQAPWLHLTPERGLLAAAGTTGVQVQADVSALSVGIYQAQVVITVQRGSIQAAGQVKTWTIQVSLRITTPCTLQVLPTGLTFKADLFNSPRSQTLQLKESGTCDWPITWQVATDAGSGSWLLLSAQNGQDMGTTGSSITISIDMQGKLLGQYRGQITFTASNRNGEEPQGCPQVVFVTLNVLAG